MSLYIIDHHLALEIEKWLSYLQKNLNYSNKTIIAYGHNVRYFICIMNNKNKKSLSFKDILALTLKDFRYFLEHRKTQDLMTHRSLTRNLSALKSFYIYHERQTAICNEALMHLTINFKNRALPKPIEQQDLFDILDYLQTLSHPKDWVRVRNFALALLLYGCGLRISEALSLTMHDISTRSTNLRIAGKGGKIRFVPYLENIRQAIGSYLKHCPYHLSTEQEIFVGVQGKPLNSRVFYEVLKDAYCYLDIPYQFSAHNFRHSCASHLLNDGANLRMIQSLMGHKSLSATETYLKVDHQHLQNVIAKAHPRR